MSKEMPNQKDLDMIRAMFDSRNNRDLADLRKTNNELKPIIENSNRVLRGEIDINKLLPPSSQSK